MLDQKSHRCYWKTIQCASSCRRRLHFIVQGRLTGLTVIKTHKRAFLLHLATNRVQATQPDTGTLVKGRQPQSTWLQLPNPRRLGQSHAAHQHTATGHMPEQTSAINTLFISQVVEQCGFCPLTSTAFETRYIWFRRSPEQLQQLLKLQQANQLIRLGSVWMGAWIEIRYIVFHGNQCTRYVGWKLRKVFSLVTDHNYVTDKSVGHEQQWYETDSTRHLVQGKHSMEKQTAVTHCVDKYSMALIIDPFYQVRFGRERGSRSVPTLLHTEYTSHLAGILYQYSVTYAHGSRSAMLPFFRKNEIK